MKEYLSIQEFSNAVNKTQQSIYKRLKNKEDKLNNYIKLEGGKKLINRLAAKDLYGIDLDGENYDENGMNGTDPKEISGDRELIEILKGQIEDQKKEIERKNKQIDDLNDRLGEITQTLNQQQKLSLMDKQKIMELEDLQKKQTEIDPGDKEDSNQGEHNQAVKKWWQFWKQ